MPKIKKTECKWIISDFNNEEIEKIAQKNSISHFVARLLLNRGITDPDDIAYFLHPNPKINIASYDRIDELGKLLVDIIKDQKQITVFGDYDVDGITSTALLVSFLKSLNANVNYSLPSRYREGYGLSLKAVKDLADKGTQVLITVDCGISNLKEIELAKELGMTVIVTDHHSLPDTYPPADFIINPKIENIDGLDKLAGVGVVFLLVKSLGEYLNIPKKVIAEYLDFVAIGTIADIVPLIGVNRSIIKRGIKYVQESKRHGIKALCKISSLSQEDLDPDNIAFQLAPRLNASGRIAEPETALELFLTDSKTEATDLAARLNNFNQKRQKLCDVIFKQADEIISQEIDLTKDKVIVAVKSGWSHGVIGIVASKLSEKYYKPVFLIAMEGDKGVGSARSKCNFHIYQALKDAGEYLDKYGGHKGAGGMSLKKENISMFKEKIKEFANATIKDEDLIPSVMIDMALDIDSISDDLYTEINHLAPFGHENPKPVFASYDVEVVEQFTSKDGKHLLFKVAGKNSQAYKAVFWGNGELYPLPPSINIAYAIESCTRLGETYLQLNVIDLKA